MARSAAVRFRAEETTAVSAVDNVIEAIKAGIRRGRFVPGQRLVEPDLIRELHVSRGSLREALRRLEAEGLVQIELYRGASIRKMTRNEFIEINQIRALLEGLAASLAAQWMDDSQRKRLQDLDDKWNRGASGWSFAQYNEAFHDLVLAGSKHSQLPGYLEQAQLLFFRLQFHRIHRTPAAERRSHLEHQRVTKAIVKGNAAGAERAMRDHVQKSGLEILSAPEEFFAS